MAENENNLSDAEERPSIRKVIRAWARTWAVPSAATIAVVIGISQGISHIVKTEIAPLKQNVANLERRFDIFDGKLAEFDGKFAESDKRIDKLETEVALNSLKLKFVLETLGRVERKLDARLSRDGDEGQPQASMSETNGEAPAVPVAKSTGPTACPAAD